MLDLFLLGASFPRAATMIGALLALVFFTLLGRALCRDGVPEAHWAAGWGAVAIAMTSAGVAGLPLWAGVVPLIPVAAFGAVRLGADAKSWTALGRVLLLALPFLWIVAAMNVSAVDTFTHWLPNAVQLADHHAFPTLADRGATEAYPAFPYNLQFVHYLLAVTLPVPVDTAMLAFNGFMVVALAWILIRWAGRSERVPAWGAVAVALMLATLLNPTFVPAIALVPYGDASTALLVLVSAWLLWRMLEEAPAGGAQALQAGLAIAALVNVKQANPALVGVLAIAFVVVALTRPQTRGMWLVKRFAVAFLPAALLLVIWRLYVAEHLPGGENRMLPFEAWQWANLPAIFTKMLKVAGQKSGYFGLMAAVAVTAALGLARKRDDGMQRLALATALVFLGYNAFLVIMYVGHFQGSASLNIQSYWRFNTQLGPLALVTGLLILRAWAERRHWRWSPSPARLRVAAAVAVALCLAGPLLGIRHLRVDLKADTPLVWGIAEDLAREAAPGSRLAMVVPGDNGNLTWPMLGVLKQSAARRTDMNVSIHVRLPAEIHGMDLVWLGCVPAGHEAVFGRALPQGAALLVENRAGEWHPIRTWEREAGHCAQGGPP